MKSRTPYVAGIATVALVAALAAWLARAEPDAEGAPVAPAMPATADAGVEPDAELAVIEAKEAAPVAAREAVVSATPAPVAEESAAAQGVPADEAELVVTVVARGTGAPIAAARLMLLPDDRSLGTSSVHVAASTARLGEAPVTDDEGRATFRVPPDVAVEIRSLGSLDVGPCEQSVAALAAGERREVVLEVPVGADLRLVGRVIADGEGPLVGASVRFLSSGPRAAAPIETTSGPDGFFQAQLPSWARLSGRVDSDGFGPALFRVQPGYEERERALEVVLRRGAVLRGRVSGEMTGAHVVVTANAWELLSGSVFSFVDDLTWSAKLGVDGTWELRDLPARVSLEVVLHVRGRVQRTVRALVLEPGEERVLDWHVGAGATIRGTALVGSEPLAGHDIWLVAEGGIDVAGPLSPYRDPAAKTRTDAEGRFHFEGVGAGAWLVGPAPRDWPDVAVVVPLGQRVEVPPGMAEVEVLVEAHRGIFIRGVVLRPSGEPMPEAHLFAHGVDHAMYENGESDEDGSFAIGPLVPGTYSVQASDTGGYAASDSVIARAGDEGVVLTLKAGGGLSGVTLDAATGEPCSAEVMVAAEDAFGLGWTLSPRPDGRFDLDGLSPDTYSIIARTGNLVGVLDGIAVTAGHEVRDLEVRLEPGARLSVRFAGLEDHVVAEVRSGSAAEGIYVARGVTEERVLPAGDATVRFLAWTAEEPVLLGERTVRLVVGERTEVAWPEPE